MNASSPRRFGVREGQIRGETSPRGCDNRSAHIPVHNHRGPTHQPIISQIALDTVGGQGLGGWSPPEKMLRGTGSLHRQLATRGSSGPPADNSLARSPRCHRTMSDREREVFYHCHCGSSPAVWPRRHGRWAGGRVGLSCRFSRTPFMTPGPHLLPAWGGSSFPLWPGARGDTGVVLQGSGMSRLWVCYGAPGSDQLNG